MPRIIEVPTHLNVEDALLFDCRPTCPSGGLRIFGVRSLGSRGRLPLAVRAALPLYLLMPKIVVVERGLCGCRGELSDA
jgi:hypothetical protein